MTNIEKNIRGEDVARQLINAWSLQANGKEIPNELKYEELSKLEKRINDTSTNWALVDFTTAIQEWVKAEYFVVAGGEKEGLFFSENLKGLFEKTFLIIQYLKKTNGTDKQILKFDNFWAFNNLEEGEIQKNIESIRTIIFNIKWYNLCLELSSDILEVEALKFFKIDETELENKISELKDYKKKLEKLFKENTDKETEERLGFLDRATKGLNNRKIQIPKNLLEKTKLMMENYDFNDEYFMKFIK